MRDRSRLLARLLQHIDARFPTLVSTVDPSVRRRHRRIVQHWSRRPPPALLVAEITPSRADVDAARRLLAAYRATQSSAPPQEPSHRDVWTLIASTQRDFATLLNRDDPEQLAAYLCNVSRHSAAHGIAQGNLEYERLQRDRRYHGFLVRMAHDKLILLAEAVGAIPPDNPEQGEHGQGVRSRPEDLVEGIEQRLGLSIAPPDVDGAMLKLHTSRGLFGERDLNAIYTAHLLRGLAADEAESSVCEIGAGTGRVAYWARRMGLRSYTIVDLPLVNVVQGFYALRTMPHDEVVLYGERPVGEGAGCLRILPPHAVGELGDTHFDLFLNQDSMPEMHEEVAAGYIAWIARVCRGAFMSINHETKPAFGDLVHLSVNNIAARVGGLRLDARYQYWLRRGYVVEVYRPQATPASLH